MISIGCYYYPYEWDDNQNSKISLSHDIEYEGVFAIDCSEGKITFNIL